MKQGSKSRTRKGHKARPGATRPKHLRHFRPRVIKLAACPVCAAPLGRRCRVMHDGKPGAVLTGRVHQGRRTAAHRVMALRADKLTSTLIGVADEIVSDSPALSNSKLVGPCILASIACVLPLPPSVRVRILVKAAQDAINVLLPPDLLKRARAMGSQGAPEAAEGAQEGAGEESTPMPHPEGMPPAEGE